MAINTQKLPSNNQSQNSAAPGFTEDYIAQVSKEIEGRVTMELSKEFNRTESRILGALSKLDEFLLNPQFRIFSRITPGTIQNTDVENQEPGGDRSQNDLHPEVEVSACRASNLTDSDPEETSHKNIQFSAKKFSERISREYRISLLGCRNFPQPIQWFQENKNEAWFCFEYPISDFLPFLSTSGQMLT